MGAKATSRPQGERIVRTYRAEGGAIVEKFAVMQGTADDQAKVVTGANVPCVGIVAEGAGAAAAGDLISVVEFGETIAIAGAGLAPNLPVDVDADGKVITAAGADQHVIGFTRSTAAAEDDEILVFVCPSPKKS